MKYYTKMHTETETDEISVDDAKRLLKAYYDGAAIDNAIDNGKAFRLRTPTREIWTKDDDGRIAMAGFFGICG